MTVAMARAGKLGFFGAAGVSLTRIEAAINEIETALGTAGPAWGTDLIHSPLEPGREAALVELYLRRRVRRVSASAFMTLTPAVVRYAFAGVRLDPATGTVHRPNQLFAKVSRPEFVRQFMSPPPSAILDRLLADGMLTAAEAELAAGLPVAGDIVLEADSGGHTDNRPLTAIFPTILRLRDELVAEHGQPIRVGAAGGIGTPSAVAAAFVLTASVNQAAVESGLSEAGKRMLAEAGPADVAMAPSADMFEMGVKVQVLRRGTMFAGRAAKLYELYTRYPSLKALNDIFMFMCFSKTPALSPTQDCRPFSDQADGTMLGEGVAMLALKRLADAERDRDRIYAVIGGVRSSSDGRAKSIYAPRPEGQARALRWAYEAAGYPPSTVELVEAHGTGTKAGDAAEVMALCEVFRASGRNGRPWCALGSVKSQVGHTKAAAGGVSLLKAILSLQHGVLPPTMKVNRPNPKLELESSFF